MRQVAAPEGPQSLPADWLQRLRAALPQQPDHRPENWRFGATLAAPTAAMRASMTAEPRPSAVLIPLVERGDQAAILLTVRSAELRQHAGQISFPGGRLEAGDADPLAAALRETHEEIGVDARFIEPLGYLPDHLVLTGFRITPIVALLRPGYQLRLDATEVADVFELPLHYMMNPQNYRLSTRLLRGFEVAASDLDFDGRNIWGATAGMLVTLRELLRARWQ